MECNAKHIRELLAAWELGLLDDEERREVEQHLLECQSCYDEVKRFADEGDLMREDGEIKELVLEETRDLIGTDTDESTAVSRIRWLRPALAVAAILALLIIRPWRIEFQTEDVAVAESNRLAVLYFDNLIPGGDSLQLGKMTAHLLTADLSEFRQLPVVSSQLIGDLWRSTGHDETTSLSRDDATWLAEKSGARWMLTGSILQMSPQPVFTWELADLENNTVAGSGRTTGEEGDDVFAMVDRMSTEIRFALPKVSEEPSVSDPRVGDITTHSALAYHHYLNGIEAFARMYYAEAQSSFELAVRQDSTFAMAYYYLSLVKDRALIEQAVEFSDRAGVIDRLYIEGRHSLLSGDTSGFVESLKEIADNFPTEKQPHYLLGVFEHEHGRLESAREYLARAIAVDPDYREAINHLAYVFVDLNRFDSALWAADRYLSLSPDEANPWDTRGDILLLQNEIDSAMASYHRAMLLKPDFALTRVKLANLHLHQRNFADAERLYSDRLYSGNATEAKAARADLASVKLYQGLVGEAMNQLELGLAVPIADSLSPPLMRTHINLLYSKALILEETERLDEAIAAVENAMEARAKGTPGDSITYRPTYLRLLAEAGRVSECERLLQNLKDYLQRTNQTMYWYHLAKGYVDLASDRHNLAIIAFEKAVSLAPDYDRFRPGYGLAVAHLHSGEYEKAVDHLEGLLIGYSPDKLGHAIMRTRLHYLLGQAYEATNNPDRAEEQYQLFLDYWSSADTELAAVTDARARLGRLESRP